MDSLEWICNELKTTRDLISSNRRERELTFKRWIISWFFLKMGKNQTYIGHKMGINRSSVWYAKEMMNDDLKAVAEELFMKYATEVLGEKVSFEPTAKRTIKIKRPDYHKNTTYFEEVELDSIKPMKKIRRWDL